MKHSNLKTNVHNLVLAAMFLALALVLPFLTGQIPQIGGMLLPMHLPVFLCGPLCHAMARWRKVMICARVQVVPGSKVVEVVPWVTPLSTAQATASA